MGATDAVITFAGFMKIDFPGGAVRLCDGGILDYASERYEAQHAVFGTIAEADEIEASFGDSAEDGTLTLAPNPDAALADWWRADLADCRVRVWTGEVDADGVTVSSATQAADLLVDTVERVQQERGGELLRFELIGRGDKLFLKNEGNVVSDTYHQYVWPGELGCANCTDLVGYRAWGAATPARSAGGSTTPIVSRVAKIVVPELVTV